MPESAAVNTETENGMHARHCDTAIGGRPSVRSIGTDLGVNLGWQEQQQVPQAKALVVPPYQGAAEIGKMALMFTLWTAVEGYLYGECGVRALDSAGEEKKHLAILNESETMMISLLCLLNNEPYTAGGLVDAMLGSDASTDQRGNARKRLINRTLPVIAGRYGLLQFQENNNGNLREYSIARSIRLAAFAEQKLVAGVQQITGAGQ